MQPGGRRRELLVSKSWGQAAILVFLFGFFVLGLMAFRTYSQQPPIPEEVVGPKGEVVFTGEEVKAGQKVFLKNGLMQYGSVFGHGGYLGPDYTADYLRRASMSVKKSYEGGGEASAKTVSDFKKNRYEEQSGTLRYTGPQAEAFGEVRGYYANYFGEPAPATG